MKLGAMISDIFTSFFRRPITQTYPYQKTAAPERLRGKLMYDASKCTGCQLCCKDCPSNAIELITIDRAKKQFLMRYHIDRCTFCSQCVVNCRFKCMEMSNEQWELAALNKESFEVYYGSEANLKQFMEKFALEEAASKEAKEPA